MELGCDLPVGPKISNSPKSLDTQAGYRPGDDQLLDLARACIALVIASPIAWWVMDKWLQDFAYRVQISWWVFVLAALVALLIAFVTVSLQSIKAALVNPVKSLKSE